MRSRQHLVIFARHPIAGGGKRRLAVGIGAIDALRFQRVRLAVLVGRFARDPRWTTWLAVTPDRSGPWPQHVSRIGQGRGDLGRRMGRVMTTVPKGRVVIIGTDIPGIAASDIAAAFVALGANAAVFGPAIDGGYWLVGLKRTPRVVLPFRNVRWSTRYALTDTERNLPGAAVAHLRTLEDVDDAASLQRHPDWGRMCPPPPSHRDVSR